MRRRLSRKIRDFLVALSICPKCRWTGLSAKPEWLYCLDCHRTFVILECRTNNQIHMVDGTNHNRPWPHLRCPYCGGYRPLPKG